MSDRVLVVAPSWVGDAILSEPLVARLHAQTASPIDVLAPAWCAPVYARMRGVGRVMTSTIGHGKVDWGTRRALARALAGNAYTHAVVLPNSWKSALVPWLARIPRRTGYVGELRWGLINDARKLDRNAVPRLVDRFVVLADPPGATPSSTPSPVLVADMRNRALAVESLKLDVDKRIAILCPGAEFGPAKRWPAAYFGDLAGRFLAEGRSVWLVGSPNDRVAADAVMAELGGRGQSIRDLCGRTDLGTAIDLMSLASVVVSNDSGLMHAAAALGAPLVALFGSSSPAYTPPLSPVATIAKIDIACSPCFKRECPLGHFKCMRDLTPSTVYDLSRSAPRREDSDADADSVDCKTAH